jgi:hypothetical protein
MNPNSWDEIFFPIRGTTSKYCCCYPPLLFLLLLPILLLLLPPLLLLLLLHSSPAPAVIPSPTAAVHAEALCVFSFLTMVEPCLSSMVASSLCLVVNPASQMQVNLRWLNDNVSFARPSPALRSLCVSFRCPHTPGIGQVKDTGSLSASRRRFT